MTAHTPTPWVRDPRSGRTTMVYSDDATGSAIADCAPSMVHRSQAECEANAAFIVRACNAHDELVEALSALLSLHGTPHQDEWLNPQAFKFAQDVTDKARAALSKATGR